MAGVFLKCECDKGSIKLPLWPVTRDGLLQKASTTTEGANSPPEGFVSSYSSYQNTRNIL